MPLRIIRIQQIRPHARPYIPRLHALQTHLANHLMLQRNRPLQNSVHNPNHLLTRTIQMTQLTDQLRKTLHRNLRRPAQKINLLWTTLKRLPRLFRRYARRLRLRLRALKIPDHPLLVKEPTHQILHIRRPLRPRELLALKSGILAENRTLYHTTRDPSARPARQAFPITARRRHNPQYLLRFRRHLNRLIRITQTARTARRKLRQLLPDAIRQTRRPKRQLRRRRPRNARPRKRHTTQRDACTFYRPRHRGTLHPQRTADHHNFPKLTHRETIQRIPYKVWIPFQIRLRQRLHIPLRYFHPERLRNALQHPPNHLGRLIHLLQVFASARYPRDSF